MWDQLNGYYVLREECQNWQIALKLGVRLEIRYLRALRKSVAGYPEFSEEQAGEIFGSMRLIGLEILTS